MVIIRLTRAGAKKRPFYNVRVADSRRSRDGAFLERVGYFNPGARGQEKRLELNLERIESWIALGAQPSDRVKRLIKDFKLGEQAFSEKREARLAKRTKRTQMAREQQKREALVASSAETSADAGATEQEAQAPQE